MNSQVKPAKPPRLSQVEMTELVLPQHTNALGTVFGGVVMSWVDIAAATCALRHCQQQVVTASIDAMHFLAPVKQGWIVTLNANMNYVHRTSCEIGVRITAENPITGEKHHTASAYLTFVALDSFGRVSPIPELILETDVDKRRAAGAVARRAARLELKKSLTPQQ